MAFVFRTKKDLTIDTLDKTEIGPGDYQTLDTSTARQVSPRNKAPFLSSSKRLNDSYDPSPGPGQYTRDENFDFLSKISQAMTKNSSATRKIHLSGFNSTNSRFEEKVKDSVPGVGSYELQTKVAKADSAKVINSQNSLLTKPDNKGKLQIFRINSSIRSIPSKNHRGYHVLADGTLIIAQDPNKLLKTDGDNTVGPGAYDLNDNCWKNKGTCWAKSRTKKIAIFDQNKEEEFMSEHKESAKSINYDVKKDIKKSPFKVLYRKVRNKFLEKIKSNKNDETLDKAQEVTPGPGYYNISESFSKIQTIPSQFQFFGSGSSRFSKDKLNNLGPGYYFKTETEKELDTNRSTKVIAPFNSNTEREVFVTKQDDSNPVSVKNSTIAETEPSSRRQRMKKINLNAVFSSKEERFPSDQEKLNLPGPGYYQRSLINAPNKRYSPSFKSPERPGIVSKEALKNSPGIGTYNLEIPYSLQYSSFKKSFTAKKNKVAFISNKKRFDEKDDKIGPGQYYKEKSFLKESANSNHPPFNIGDKKEAISLVKADLSLIGPGRYNVDSHFDWNKKSFNMLYLN